MKIKVQTYYENGALKMILLPNGYIKNNQYYFYLKDHLGNNAVVCDANGNVVQETYYHPYGKPIASRGSGANVQTYKYNGKEQETMMGLEQYDLGNRTLDYTYDQFTTMDRFAEKTPWQSPYVVAAGNPVNYVDVNGDSVWINYDNENGQAQKMLYTAGMKSEGNNAFVSTSVNYLNSMYNNGGSVVLNELMSSSNSFNMVNKVTMDANGKESDALSFLEFNGGGGNINAGLLMKPNYSEYYKVEGVAHEFFHALQYEIEAMVYSSIISSNWFDNTPDYIGSIPSARFGNGTANGNLYQQYFSDLTNNGFSQESFFGAVRLFQSSSNSNNGGLYNKYPIHRDQTKSLLKQYYPKP